MNKTFKAMKAMIAMVAVVFGMMAFTGTASAAGGVVTGVKQVDATSNSVTLSWDAVLGTDVRYTVEMSTDGITYNEVRVDYGTSTSSCTAVKITASLSPGCKYYVKVCAYTDFYSSANKQLIAESVPIVVETLAETDSSRVDGVVQTDATEHSITLAWNPVAGATSYTVEVGVNSDYMQVAVVQAPLTTATITNLQASYKANFYVTANLSTSSGITQSTYRSWSVAMRTAPAKVQKAGMTNFYDSINVAYYGCTSVNNCDGYQLQIQDSKGKVLYTNTSSSASFRISPFWKGKFVRARMRAYINIGTERKYGAWSAFSYSASSKKVTVKRTANKKKITVNWKKISGADGYKVSIATSQNGKYNKVKSLGKKASKCTITKCGKKKLNKRMTYYIKVQYLIKVGGKKVSSQVAGMGSI